MQAHATETLDKMGHVYDKIEKQLLAAGLLVKKVGGEFSSETRMANFLNAVPGQTPDGKGIYITLGSSIKPLQQEFEKTLREVGIEHVRFVGNDVTSTGYTAGEESLLMAGGIDCRESGHAGVENEGLDLLHRALHPR